MNIEVDGADERETHAHTGGRAHFGAIIMCAIVYTKRVGDKNFIFVPTSDATNQ